MAKIDEYKAQIKAKNTGTAYIKTGGNWFDEKGWLDDYDATPEPVVTRNGKRQSQNQIGSSRATNGRKKQLAPTPSSS